MQDEMIVELYWQRDETAISETEKKYGRHLTKIAYNILSDFEDSKESVNDTCLVAWNTIPPQKPSFLSTYLAKIVRRVSIDTFRKKNRDKRRASEYSLSLDELGDCVSGGDATQQAVDLNLLGATLNSYLKTLSDEARNVFVCRYYFADSIRDIAVYFNMSESKVKSMLHRTRIGLKAYLEQEGFVV